MNALRLRYASHAHPKVFDWEWGKTHYNRIALVNLLVGNAEGWNTKYLEIGCESNALFDSVACRDKTGVDPARGGTERMTSDAFFAQNQKTFDVVFIDGLHHYEQVRKDAIAALDCLNEGGWVAFHDMLPRNWKEQHVPQLVMRNWTGDCWKLAVELGRAAGLEFRLLKIDHGVGLLRKKSSQFSIPDLRGQLVDAQFDVFVDAVNSFPLIDFDEAVAWVGSS